MYFKFANLPFALRESVFPWGGFEMLSVHLCFLPSFLLLCFSKITKKPQRSLLQKFSGPWDFIAGAHSLCPCFSHVGSLVCWCGSEPLGSCWSQHAIISKISLRTENEGERKRETKEEARAKEGREGGRAAVLSTWRHHLIGRSCSSLTGQGPLWGTRVWAWLSRLSNTSFKSLPALLGCVILFLHFLLFDGPLNQLCILSSSPRNCSSLKDFHSPQLYPEVHGCDLELSATFQPHSSHTQALCLCLILSLKK